MKHGKFDYDLHLCSGCGQRHFEEYVAGLGRPVHEMDRHTDVPVFVDRVIISEIHDAQFVVLREATASSPSPSTFTAPATRQQARESEASRPGGERFLPVLVGIFEATAMDRILRGMKPPRPLTYDSWLASVAACGASVQSVCISDLREEVYFAELRLARGSELLRIDLRPSDALAIGLRAGVPLLVTDWLLSQAAASGMMVPYQ